MGENRLGSQMISIKTAEAINGQVSQRMRSAVRLPMTVPTSARSINSPKQVND
jgi:hypothetical protein